jgi:hypothetical protein
MRSRVVRTKLRVAVVGSAAALCLAATAAAQTTPPRRLLAKPPARNSWSLSTTAEQGWDSNVSYLAGKDPDYVRRLNAQLAVIRVGPRGSVGLRGSGGAISYERRKEFETFQSELALEGTRRISPLNTGTATGFYSRRLTTDLFGGLGLPILGGLILQQSVGGSVMGVRRLTPRTSARVDATYTSVTFDSPALIPGSVFGTVALLSHRYARQSSVSLGAEVQQGTALGNPLALQTVSAGWSPELGGVQARLIAGGTRISSGGPASYLPTGLAELSDSLGKGLWRAGFVRSASQAFGLGRYLTTNAGSIGYDVQAGEGNFLSLGAFIASSAQSGTALPGQQNTPFRTRAATAAYRRVLSSGITLGLGASYRERDDFVKATGYSGNFALGYTLGRRASR